MSLCNFTLFAPYLHQANIYFLCFITETQLQNSLKVLKGKKSCIQYISSRTEFTIPITILKACLLKKKNEMHAVEILPVHILEKEKIIIPLFLFSKMTSCTFH